MNTLWLDLETFCPVPIGNGSHAYAEKAEVLLATYAWDEGPVECLDFTDGDTLDQLEAQIAHARLIVIHNSGFDRTVLRWQGIVIEPERVYDTMVQAYLHSLPGGLGPLCDVLGVDTDKAKDKDGKRLIHLFCKPLPKNSILRRATRLTHPEEWERFKTYAMLDVEAMRAARKAMPVWNFPEPGSNTGDQREVRLWQLDQKINDRGFAVDTVLAEAAVRAAKRASKSLAARTAELTEDQVQATTQRDALLKYFLEEHDVTITDLKKGTVRDLLKLELPPEVRELLENRLQASATAPAKYGALLKSVSSDTRLRGTIQFAGAARTARFSGRIFQPHNLPRPTMKGPAIEAGIRAIKAGTEDLIYDNVMDLCGNAVRGCVVAPEGHKLVIADLSNIEGRVLAWLAGELWKLAAFRDYDTVLPDGTRRGHDLYKIGAGLILGKPPEEVTDDERQISGKIPELACVTANTQVLTHTGIKAIVDITTDDLLWDGDTWVRHAGIIARGVRSTIPVCGVEMTPDHLILCGPHWKSAQTVVNCPRTLNHALATGSESLRSLPSNENALAGSGAFGSDAPVAASPTSSTHTICDEGRLHAAIPAPNRPLGSTRSSGLATRTSFLTTPTAADCATGSRPASTDAEILTTQATLTTGGEASECLLRGSKTGPPSWGTSSLLTGGTNPSLNSTGATSIEATNPETSVSSPEKSTGRTSEASEKCSPASTNLKPVYDVVRAGPKNRFTVLGENGTALVIHNCGYGGSLGAFKVMAALYGVNLSDDAIRTIVAAFRKRNSRIVALWYALEKAVRLAVQTPGEVYRLEKLSVRCDGTWLRIRLPSGRYLCYPGVELDEDGGISYLGTNQYTRKWERIRTYGGKLVENVTQAVARDILTHGMEIAERAGYAIVLHVHDEIISETPDTPQYTSGGLAACMSQKPYYAMDLPLSAAGFETKRYRKG